MKLQMVRGCVCDSLNVDGKEEIDLTDDERALVLRTILNSELLKKNILSKPGSLNQLIQFVAREYFDTYEVSDEPCDCCDDYVETFELEI